MATGGRSRDPGKCRFWVSSYPPPRVLGVHSRDHPFRSLSGHFLSHFGQITLHLLCAVATGGRFQGAHPGVHPGCTPGIPVSPSTAGPSTTPERHLLVTFWSLSGQLLSNNSLITVCSGYWRQIPGCRPGVHPGCTPGTTLRHPSCALPEPFMTKNSLFLVCSGYWRQIPG